MIPETLTKNAQSVETWPKRGRATLDYQAAYPDPLVMQAGDELHLGRQDEQWPGWIWCTSLNGMEGWVPISYLEVRGKLGIARSDYTARELTIHVGEKLTIWDFEAGWYWASNPDSCSGWIPGDHIDVIEYDHP